MSPSTPPARALVGAAREFARVVAGTGVRRVVVVFEDLSRVAIDVPAEPGAPQADADLPAGWCVRDRKVYLDGKPVEVPHQPGRVLRALAEAAAPLGWPELVERAWRDDRTEKTTVENTITRLRKALREVLNLARRLTRCR